MKQIYDFNANLPLVMEVVNFIKSGSLLKVKDNISSNKLFIDFEQAKDCAWEKFYFTKNSGDEGYTWTDLKAEEVSELYGAIFKHKNRDKVEKQLELFHSEIEDKLWLKNPYDEIVDDLGYDFSSIINSRALQGMSNPFFEKLFAAYKSGGWPCGWHGTWPDGEPIVFYPPNDFVK